MSVKHSYFISLAVQELGQQGSHVYSTVVNMSSVIMSNQDITAITQQLGKQMPSVRVLGVTSCSYLGTVGMSEAEQVSPAPVMPVPEITPEIQM